MSQVNVEVPESAGLACTEPECLFQAFRISVSPQLNTSCTVRTDRHHPKQRRYSYRQLKT
jgi:hypothetical protein